MFENHYGESTAYITLEGITPFANSTPVETIFLGKKFTKELRKNNILSNSFMNVCYEKQQAFVTGTVLKWKLRGDITNVYLIEEKKLFVKGKNFWVYCVGIIEC